MRGLGRGRGKGGRTVYLLRQLALLRERDEDLLRRGLGDGALEVGGDVHGAKRAVHLPNVSIARSVIRDALPARVG